MPALDLGWRSQSDQDGGHGDWLMAGNPREGISSGLRPSHSNFLPSAYAHFQVMANTLWSMATTEELSRAGGRDAVPTSPPIESSAASSSLWRIAIEQYTRNTSQVLRTPQMPPPVVATPLLSSYLTLSPSPRRSDPSSSTSDLGELLRRTVVKRLVRAQEPEIEASETDLPATKHRKVLETRPRHLPLPPTTTPPARVPAPYPQNLTPTPSLLRLHCLA